MSSPGATRRGPRLTIGQVLSRLRDDFPGISISKIRFLEAEGLVEPERTPSGYRKFSDADVERLRYVLRVQRDQYLPLKVIREHLDAMDRGLEPPTAPGERPQAPQAAPEVEGSDDQSRAPVRALRLSRGELLANSGLDEGQLRQLEDFQMIAPVAGTSYYGADELDVARSAREFARYGVEPRHLRLFKTSADREAGLVEQVLAPHRGRRATSDDARAEMAASLADLALRLHRSLMRSAGVRAGWLDHD